MSKAVLEIEGFVSEPRLGQTKSGKAMASVSVAHTPRRKNRETGEFEDVGDTLWVRATFFDDMADLIGSEIRKGMLVKLKGEPRLNTFEGQNGFQASIELQWAEIAVVPRAVRGQGASASSSAHSGQGQSISGAQNDGWHNPGQPFDDLEAPF